MGKHAYLIIAHHNWWQLKKLLELLDDSRNEIFLHIDKKVKNVENQQFESCCRNCKVSVFQDVEVSWAGYSQIECELSLFQHAIDVSEGQKFDFYHLISGADLPLKSQDKIHAFFDEHKDQNFIEYNDEYAATDECLGRMRYYFWAYDMKIKHGKKAIIYLDKLLRVFQRTFRVNRLKKFPEKVYMGSNWVSLTEEAVRILLNHKDFIAQYFRWTSSGDELYKHTILRNSGINIYSLDKDHVHACLRYIDFSEGKPNPRTLTGNDYQKVMESGALFARKFDECVDREVIKQIIRRVQY